MSSFTYGRMNAEETLNEILGTSQSLSEILGMKQTLEGGSGIPNSHDITTKNINRLPQQLRAEVEDRGNNILSNRKPPVMHRLEDEHVDAEMSFSGLSGSNGAASENITSSHRDLKRKAEIEENNAVDNVKQQKTAQTQEETDQMQRELPEVKRFVAGSLKSFTIHAEFGEIVRIFVGRPELGPVQFTIHAIQIRRAWPSFLDAIEKANAGHEEKAVSLENTSPFTFSVVAKWIYSGTGPHIRPPHHEGTLVQALNVYFLGRVYDSKDIQNGALDSLCDCFRIGGLYPSESIIRRIYSNTSAGSPLRQLLVDLYAWKTPIKQLNPIELPREFVEQCHAEIIRQAGRRRRLPAFMDKSAYSVYHRIT